MGFDGRGATDVHKILYHILEKIGLYDPSLFAITTKTITFNPIVGLKEIRPLKNGWWNDYGLDNPGFNRFLLDYGREIKKQKNIIVSIAGRKRYDLRIMSDAILSKFDNNDNIIVIGIEYNISCPNREDTHVGANEAIRNTEFLRKNMNDGVALILEVGKGCNNYKMIAKETEGMVKAIRINSIPASNGGALSGKIIQSENWQIMEELINASRTPIIAPSIWDYEDIDKVLSKGARGVDFGSVQMVHPRRLHAPILPTMWARRYEKEQKQRDTYLKSAARASK